MKVELDFEHGVCCITREPKDPKFYGPKYYKGLHRFLYHVKQELQKQGYNVIKKRMGKDGHLTDDVLPYLRDRKWKFCIWDQNYMVRIVERDFNQDGRVCLRLEQWGDDPLKMV